MKKILSIKATGIYKIKAGDYESKTNEHIKQKQLDIHEMKNIILKIKPTLNLNRGDKNRAQ